MSGRAGAVAVRHLLIIAPFWGAPAHVGVYRVDRFTRWARAFGIRVTIVRAGNVDRVERTGGVVEISVADPIRFYRDPAPSDAGPATGPRRENRLRRIVATTVLSPDPGVAWARRAASHPAVLDHARGADWVLSSSPPESSHVCAWLIARAANVRFLADLRDGWLDDPLKPALRHSRLRRWHERGWERRVVGDAACVLVTSNVWREMLVARYPDAAPRTVVLTNGYPPDAGAEASVGRDRPSTSGRPLELVHAGRFTTSRATQTVARLLEPLLAGVRRSAFTGHVRLLGDLAPADIAAVGSLRPEFAAAGWTLECADRVPRHAALAALERADGLLLLSATPPTIPSKLFEYLPTRRPVFAVTPVGGAVWQACAAAPQVTLVARDAPAAAARAAADFLARCAEGPAAVAVPAEFAEPALARVFAGALGLGAAAFEALTSPPAAPDGVRE